MRCHGLQVFVFLAMILMLAPVIAGAQDILSLAGEGDLAGVESLVGGDPGLVAAHDQRDCTALHFAVNGGHDAVAVFLLSAGADLEARDVDGDTPLHWAACNDDLAVADLLIEQGAQIDARNHHLDTPLLYAAKRRQFAMVERLVEHGADIEAANDYGRTPLLWVVREGGNLEMTRLLLRLGADVDAQDKFGETSLVLAAWRGFRTLVGVLLDAGARIDLEPGMPQELIGFATVKGITRLYETVVAAGVEPEAAPGPWTSLLHAAATGGSPAIVGDLVARGARIDAVDVYGWTPLHCAAVRGRAEAVGILLDRGGDLKQRTLSGFDALQLAEQHGDTATIALLREQGARTRERTFPVLTGAYLGQGAPPAEPEIFAPDIVATRNGEHGTVTISPDGDEMFWAGSTATPDSGYTRSTILTSRRIDGRWTSPVEATFVSEYRGDVPCFSPDGRRLFYMTRRPLEPGQPGGKENIWCVERQGDGWGEPAPLPPCVNDMRQHWQFSVAGNGNLYFSSRTGGAETQGLYMSRFTEGRYTDPVFLGFGGESPFIAPDESYMLTFEFAETGRTTLVRFRLADGTWGAPISVSAAYPAITGLCPQVSPDGKALFFLRHDTGANNNFWVAADFLEDLRKH